MRVADVMTRGIDVVEPSATVQDAATRLAELDIGAIFVGSGDGVAGVLTDRDILVRSVVEGRNPAYVTVEAIMTPEVIACRPEDSVEAAFARMREGQFRRMPVLDPAGKPVGVVTLGDLAKGIESPEKVTEALRDLSEPHRVRASSDEGATAAPEPAATADA